MKSKDLDVISPRIIYVQFTNFGWFLSLPPLSDMQPGESVKTQIRSCCFSTPVP